MTIEVRIADPATGRQVEVTPRGQLVVAPLSFSDSFSTSVNVANTAFNLVLPKESQRFIVTDIVLTGDKNINNTVDATVIVYEADDQTSLTEESVLLDVNIARSASLALTGLNLITDQASKFINVKATDVNVKVTLMGFYVEE